MVGRRVRMLGGAALGAAWLFAAGPAMADITDYNAAMERQDFAAATAEAAQIWAGFDRSAPDTATMAREFGFTAYLASDFSAAQSYAEFLDREGASLATPDNQPKVSQVLLALARYKLRPDHRRRAALVRALRQRVDADGYDLISLSAAQEAQQADWTAGDWNDAIESADLSAELAARAGDELLARRRSAEIASGVALFESSYDPDAFVKLADAHDAIAADIDRVTDEGVREALWPLLHSSEVWAETARAHTLSYPPGVEDTSTGTHMRGIQSAYPSSYSLNEPSKLFQEQRLIAPAAHFTGYVSRRTKDQLLGRELMSPSTSPPAAQVAGGDARPRCAGTWAGRTATDTGTRGTTRVGVGAVLVAYAVAKDGRVSAPEALAAAPNDAFTADALEMVANRRFEPDAGANRSTCRVESGYETALVVFEPPQGTD